MLAVEGVLIAAVGVALGIALGLAYGWGGSLTVLGVLGPVELSVPWREIGVICVVALAAGLLASALPGRRAAKEPPVAALAAT
ncbi:MAG: FtsX-like permease family protein [Promicromonosporaceae bacterium]|nr:FtsX-like permease family protein [Promicromonosporaceae bacterium]